MDIDWPLLVELAFVFVVLTIVRYQFLRRRLGRLRNKPPLPDDQQRGES